MAKRLGELDVGTDVAKTDKVLVQQSSVDKQVVVSELPVPLNYIAGLITSNDSGDTEHDIAIAPGVARAGDDSTNMTRAAILTKQIDAAWAVGDDAGGMDTGAVAADTLYAVWLIKRPDTGVVDALFSLDFAAPTMPADYTKKRLIAAIRTEAGAANIIGYLQSGDYFRYLGEIVEDVNDNTITSGVFETGTLSVPPLALASIYGYAADVPGGADVARTLLIKTKGAPEANFADEAFLAMLSGAAIEVMARSGQVLVDENRQIEYASTEAADTVTVIINTFGFMMLSRREP